MKNIPPGQVEGLPASEKWHLFEPRMHGPSEFSQSLEVHTKALL